MRNLLRSRRGSAAFATVIALVPLIGVVALGGEAGSWYVTKQHAQNAADGAAYSGALTLACALANNGLCSSGDTQTVAYRGKEFASQSAFCNAGDTTAYPGRQCAASLPTGVSQAVAIDIGDYSGGAFTTPPAGNGNAVRAKVSQQQPGYLAAVLGLTTVNIPTQAIAAVNFLSTPPCALALTGSLSFQGSPNINAPNCGMASNDTANNALDFTGGGMSINLGSLSAAGGCTGAASFCNTALTFRPPIINPFATLNSVTMPTLSNCPSSSSLTAYSAGNPCKNNGVTLTGNGTQTLTGGVYFISGTLTLKGNSTINGTGLFILLPGASFSMKGTGTISITANASLTNAQLPSALQPDAGILADMAFWDLDTSNIQIGGNSDISFAGNMYAPNAALTFQGNPVINLGGGKGCGELIAKSIAFNGNATFDDSGCPAATVLKSQYVALVQ
jgi:Flp pilus assembly protein TadG